MGPLKKSGSPNVMCCAPAATWARTSARTTSRHGAEAPVVDRDDRAVAAAVLAPARRLGVADDPALAADLQRRIFRQRREIRAIGRDEVRRARSRTVGPTFRSGVSGEPAADARARHASLRQVPLELGTQDRLHAVLAEDLGVERRVEPVGADVGRRIQRANAIHHRQREARRGVHRQVERDERPRARTSSSASFVRVRSTQWTLCPARAEERRRARPARTAAGPRS